MDIEKEIIDVLKKELPPKLISQVDVIENFIEEKKFRAAYMEMYNLKKNNTWTPTIKFLSLLEKFWWLYAN